MAVKEFVNLGATSIQSPSKPSDLVSSTKQQSSILQRVGSQLVVRSGESLPLSLMIFDARGKLVDNVSTIGREIAVSMDNLPQGAYVVRGVCGGREFRQAIVHTEL